MSVPVRKRELKALAATEAEDKGHALWAELTPLLVAAAKSGGRRQADMRSYVLRMDDRQVDMAAWVLARLRTRPRDLPLPDRAPLDRSTLKTLDIVNELMRGLELREAIRELPSGSPARRGLVQQLEALREQLWHERLKRHGGETTPYGEIVAKAYVCFAREQLSLILGSDRAARRRIIERGRKSGVRFEGANGVWLGASDPHRSLEQFRALKRRHLRLNDTARKVSARRVSNLDAQPARTHFAIITALTNNFNRIDPGKRLHWLDDLIRQVRGWDLPRTITLQRREEGREVTNGATATATHRADDELSGSGQEPT